MSTNFPTSLDNGTSLPYPSSGNLTNSPSLAGGQDNQNDSLIAIQTKLGISSSTPTSGNLLIGTGVGTSTWSKVAPTGTIIGTTDSQTLTNKILTAPTINSPVITNATITTDTITGFSSASTGTIYGIAVASGQITGANTINGSAITTASIPGSAVVAGGIGTTQIANSAVDYTKVAIGFALQMVSSLYTAVATGTTTIPLDNTIPQITEGTEFMTCVITPKSTTTILKIEINVTVSLSINTGNINMALFQDTTANAVAATTAFQGTATGPLTMQLVHTMTSGTTSATTFRVRLGSNAASTVTLNSGSGVAGQLFGAITKSSIVITEYKA